MNATDRIGNSDKINRYRIYVDARLLISTGFEIASALTIAVAGMSTLLLYS